MIENNILGVVLAGGRSKRFGDDKTTAKLGNKSLLDHTIEKIEKKVEKLEKAKNKKISELNDNLFIAKKDQKKLTWENIFLVARYLNQQAALNGVSC